MSSIEVRAFDGINNTPAAKLAVCGWLDTAERGLGDGALNMSWDHKAFVAYCANGRDMLPVGVLTWRFLDFIRELHIIQSYVLPDFRGRGCYAAMWDCVVQQAGELKAVAVVSGVHMRNSTMRAIAAKQGRIEAAVTLRYELPQ